MINKKAEISVPQLIALILVVLVVVVVLISIFSPRLWDFVRALPDYKYNDTDREIEYNKLTDAELAGICPDASKVGTVGPLVGSIGFREQYINFFVKNELGETELKQTKLYWRGSETNAKIWLYKKDKYTGWDWFEKDLLVATVNERVIKVEPILLDLDSEIYQRTRFGGKILELYLLPYLENSYLAFNNQICRVAEPAKPKPTWPESVGGKLIIIEPNLYVDPETGDLASPGLYPYFDFDSTPELEFLYLVNKEDYISVCGSRRGFLARDGCDVLRIYSDGSIWLIRLIGRDYGTDVNVINYQDFMTRINPFIFRDDAYGYHDNETNLRVDYNKIRQFVKDNIGKNFIEASNINEICLVKVARISTSKKIEFCGDDTCTELVSSKLLWVPPSKKDYKWAEAEIYVDQINDEKIGEIKNTESNIATRNTEIVIDQEIIDGKGSLYFEVQNDLPEEKYLINLNGAEFKSGYLCRNEKVTPVEKKISEDFSKKGYDIESLAGTYLQIKNLLDKKIQETEWLKIGYGLNNQDNRLGFNTGGDLVTQMKLKKVRNEFYIKFSDSDYGLDDESPWILLKYWNEHRSFSWVPDEYILK